VPLPDGNVLLSYLDVTDSTRVQRALRERQRSAGDRGRLKSEFNRQRLLRLRTPLNAIIGSPRSSPNQYFGELNRASSIQPRHPDSSHRLLSLIKRHPRSGDDRGRLYDAGDREHRVHTLMASVLD